MLRARTLSIPLVALILALGAVLWLRSSRTLQGVVLTPEPAPDFVMEAAYRGAVSLTDFRDRVVLLTFGRPSCGDPCNPQLGTLEAALDRLGDRRRNVRVLYVTREPDRMTLQELLAFVQDRDLGFTGLAGDTAEIRLAMAAYRRAETAVPDSVRAAAAAAPGPSEPRIYGIDPDGVLRVLWGPGDPAVIARDVRALLRY